MFCEHPGPAIVLEWAHLSAPSRFDMKHTAPVRWCVPFSACRKFYAPLYRLGSLASGMQYIVPTSALVGSRGKAPLAARDGSITPDVNSGDFGGQTSRCHTPCHFESKIYALWLQF